MKKNMTEFPGRILRCCWCLLFLLLPFKWCYAPVTAEHANFPLNSLEWIFSTILPHSQLPVLAGILLAAGVLLYRDTSPLRHPSMLVPLLAWSPLLFGLAGLINTTEWGYAANWYWHFYSAAAISTGVWWTARHDRKLLPWLLNTIAVTTALTIFDGWRQRFGGQAELLRMQMQHAMETGRELPRHLIEKLQQSRVSGNFSDPNIYAAHLLLTVPLLLTALCRLASRCAQPRAARWLLCLTAVFFAGGALFFSGSRGAFLGLAAGITVALWLTFSHRLTRIQTAGVIAAAVAGCILLAVAVSYASSRRMETVTVRLEYYGTALEIASRFPFAGAGLGEFYPWHMRLKDGAADEARDPHSLFFAMLSQCGIPGALDALLRLGIPFALALGLLKRRRGKDQVLVCCALSGWCAWNIHALSQFNDMIIATTCHAAVIGLFAFDQDDAPDAPADAQRSRWRRAMPSSLMLVAAIVGICSAFRFPAEKRLQELEYAVQERRIATDTALAELEQLCESMPSAPFPPRMAYELANAAGRYREAADFAALLTERTPHRTGSWLRLAKMHLALNNRPEAENAILQAAEWYPNSPDLLLLRGLLTLTDRDELPAAELTRPWRTERIAVSEDSVTILLELPGSSHHQSYAPTARKLNVLELQTNDGRKAVFTTEKQ
ncbi:MAG: O-antigen ligase family protein [Victivallales bacterium]|nr:O-antigen ligase family protein [Victivallales bacterium]